MNRLKKIFIILFELILVYLILKYDINCFFKKYFGIRCVSCGLTRAFLAIMEFKFLDAFKYNIMSIPLFIFLIIINILFVFDVVFSSNKAEKFLNNLSKYYTVIIIVVVITIVINNINGI